MGLQLSTAELSTAFAGLNDGERQELMRLLEAREQIEAAKPVDTRQSLPEIVEQLVQQAADASADPEAYLAADRAHVDRCRLNVAALEQARPLADTDTEIGSYLGWQTELRAEAAKLAIADGFPPADEVVPVRRKPPSPPVDAVDLTTLPEPVRADVEYTRGTRRASPQQPTDATAPTAPPAPAYDPLAPFRGRPTGEMPIWRDGV